jgi:hypothetical protein
MDNEPDDPFAPLTPEQVERGIRDLVRFGYLRHNGLFRNGQPVYVATEKALAEGIDWPKKQTH